MQSGAVAIRIVRWPIEPRGAARGAWTERVAAVVGVRTDSGATGLGEAAPLPGMSLDTIDDAIEDLRGATGELRAVDRVADALELAARITTTPSARFAIETALLGALAHQERTGIAALWGADPESVLRCAVVVDTPDDARRAFAHGARCLKLKTGDPAHVARIAAVAPDARLRIDVNRSWPRDEVIDRLAALAGFPIEFVEEPCVASHELLASRLPCRIALDESLASLDHAALAGALRSPDLAALVLKPTLLGGFARCLELAALARARDVMPIVSHALEGPIGTAACTQLAHVIGGDLVVGLAPHPGIDRFMESV